MTKKEMFERVIALVEGTEVEEKAEIVDKLRHEVELLDNRKSASKPTAIQKANETIAHTIKVVLAEQENPVTITDLLKDARLATYNVMKGETAVTETMTNQKLSSIMKKLVDAKEVVKTMDKKRAFFSIA